MLGVECGILENLISKVRKVAPSSPPVRADEVLGLINIANARLIQDESSNLRILQPIESRLSLHYLLDNLSLLMAAQVLAVATTDPIPQNFEERIDLGPCLRSYLLTH